jgi:choline dehydrogenase-like flavoprotein
VIGVAIEQGRATGVWAREGLRRRFYPADLVVLAAGGLSTPVILQNSGIPCEPRLTVDPVLCVAMEWPDADQVREMEMPFVIQREGFILSPYFDYVSYLFSRDWRYPARNLLGIMIKLADENVGTVSRRQVCKPLTARDRSRLAEGVRLCAEMLELLRAKERPTIPSKMFLGTLNAGHPAGMLPLSERELATCHPDRLPPNLYVADATLLPAAPGNPQILTIIALAKRVCKFL